MTGLSNVLETHRKGFHSSRLLCEVYMRRLKERVLFDNCMVQNTQEYK